MLLVVADECHFVCNIFFVLRSVCFARYVCVVVNGTYLSELQVEKGDKLSMVCLREARNLFAQVQEYIPLHGSPGE